VLAAQLNASGNINPIAPTVVNSVGLEVNKTGADTKAKVSSATVVVTATTVNGSIGITPQMISSLKGAASDSLGSSYSKTNVDIKVNTIAADGRMLSVIVSTDSLKNNAKLQAYTIDPLTGGYVLTSIPAVTYSKTNGVTTSNLPGGYEYHFVSATEAKKIENSIVDSVKASETFSKPVATVAGGIVDMTKALSPSLNAANVGKIEYQVSGNKAVINPITGQLMINGNASKGTITVSIKVTLKNGKTKTVKTKIKVG